MYQQIRTKLNCQPHASIHRLARGQHPRVAFSYAAVVKINNFQGDLTGISVTKKPLMRGTLHVVNASLEAY